MQTAFIPVSKDADVYGNTMIGLPCCKSSTSFFDYFNERMIWTNPINRGKSGSKLDYSSLCMTSSLSHNRHPDRVPK